MRLYALCDQDLLDKKSISIEDFVVIAKQKNAEIIRHLSCHQSQVGTIDS